MKIGEYVLATKWHDGDPRDQWCVGFYNGKLVCENGEVANDRHLVVDSAGQNFRGNGFRKVVRISAEEGKYLVDHIKEIELSSVGLWEILSEIRQSHAAPPDTADVQQEGKA